MESEVCVIQAKRKVKVNDDADYHAVALAEGFEEGNESQVLDAWQHLVDTGLVWHLQGWFGRQARQMIDAGIIRSAIQ